MLLETACSQQAFALDNSFQSTSLLFGLNIPVKIKFNTYNDFYLRKCSLFCPHQDAFEAFAKASFCPCVAVLAEVISRNHTKSNMRCNPVRSVLDETRLKISSLVRSIRILKL